VLQKDVIFQLLEQQSPVSIDQQVSCEIFNNFYI